MGVRVGVPNLFLDQSRANFFWVHQVLTRLIHYIILTFFI